MIRGKKPKPTLLHKRHGTVNVTRHKARLVREPEPTTDIGSDAPEWMTGSQKDGWNYAIHHSPPGLLKAIDRALLAAWVETEDRWRRAVVRQAVLDAAEPELLMLAKTKEGNLIQSPYVGMINRAAQLMIKLANELGFSPAARPRLAAGTGMVIDAAPLGAPAAPRDDFDSFLAQRPASLN